MALASSKKSREAKRNDRLARWVVTLGGAAVVVSVLGILLLIVGTAIPLFVPPKALPLTAALPGDVSADNVLALGVETGLVGKQTIAHALTRDGAITFFDVGTGEVLQSGRVCPETGDAGASSAKAESSPRTLISVAQQLDPVKNSSVYTCVWTDGTVSLVEVRSPFALGTAEPGKIKPAKAGAADGAGPAKLEVDLSRLDREKAGKPRFAVHTRASVPPGTEGVPLCAVMRRPKDGAVVCAALVPGNRIVVTFQSKVENELTGDVVEKGERHVLDRDLPGMITAIALDKPGETLYAGTSNGCLSWWRFDEDGRVTAHDVATVSRDPREVRSLAVALGDMTLAVGDGEGELSTWSLVRAAGETVPTRRLRKTSSLATLPSAVREIIPSARNRTLLSLDEQGTISLDYTTSRRHLLALSAEKPLRRATLSARGDVVLGLDSGGQLAAWNFICPHPEVSWSTLFGKATYEGYSAPEYVWQATGGESSDYEGKFSLMPLLYGTLKGTFYAMLFAVPLSLMAAGYVSHFTHPGFKAWIKPAIEIMAAVPSVVLGFLVGLWLAPRLERGLAGLMAGLIILPLAFLAFLVVWQFLGKLDWARRMAHGREFLLVIPAIVLGVGLAAWLAGPLETTLFGGNAKMWLIAQMGAKYDQRNCIIIAFGLGFAVVPIIFSLTEDALSSVPHSMTAASMALGASRWQTLWRVVLPSASPGIFAAVMIGFGRAVGETMIVLMATGNTPIMEWSPLNGMRTLSANIATEIPEAAVGSTHYRVLFLCAVLLFVLTFLLNTTAEVVRQRLRKRFGRY